MQKDFDELAAQRRDQALSAALRIKTRLDRHECPKALLQAVQGRVFGLAVRRTGAGFTLSGFKIETSVPLPDGRRVIRPDEARALLTSWADLAMYRHLGRVGGPTDAQAQALMESTNREDGAMAAEAAPVAAPELPDQNTISAHVGRRIRARRVVLGQTQQDLARACGVKFQQIQKYETGFNRVSAPVLLLMARFQGVAPGYYFDGLDTPRDADDPDEVEMMAAARLIAGLPPEARGAVIRIAKAVMETGGAAQAD